MFCGVDFSVKFHGALQRNLLPKYVYWKRNGSLRFGRKVELDIYPEGYLDFPSKRQEDKCFTVGVQDKNNPMRIHYSDSTLVGWLELNGLFYKGRFNVAPYAETIDRIFKLVLSQVMIFESGLMLHSSGVIKNNRVWLFAGESGVGKTTVATQLHGLGEPFSVDRVCIKKTDNVWQAYSTPFSDATMLSKSEGPFPVQGIVFISQSENVSITQIVGMEAFMSLARNAYVNAKSKEIDKLLVDTMSCVVEEVPCYKMEFRKDETFWPILDGYAKDCQ